MMNVLACLVTVLLALTAAGCGTETDAPGLGDGASPAADAASPAVDAAPARGEPGLPAAFYGTRCTADVQGLSLPACISAPIEPRDGLTHLFLNFCVANEVDRCRETNMPSPIYVSLLLPAPAWAAGEYQAAVAGRVEVALPDGRRYRLDSGRGEAIPLSLLVRQEAGGSLGPVLRGELVMTVPRVDAPGPSITLRARVN